MTEIFVGTGAVAYPEWKGRFYPPTIKPEEAFSYYAQTFSMLELNTTFYELPSPAQIKTLVSAAPAGFPLAVKAHRFLTHIKRLKDCDEPAARFFKLLPVFGDRLGPALVQLPPNFKLDLTRLETFFKEVPKRFRIAMEFRHPTWFVTPVLDFLSKKGAALVFNDEDVEGCPLVRTAEWGYLRLRHTTYTDTELKAAVASIKKQKWSQAYVVFKHEQKATAPKLAARLQKIVEG